LIQPEVASAAETFVRTQVLMGDVPVTLTIEDKISRRQAAFEAMEKAFEEARRLENSVSEWRPQSQATLLNQNAGRALVPIGRDMTTLLLKAREISEITDGAFDITFSSKNKNAIYRDVVVIPELGLAYLPAHVKIGVSGIAKGYIVDAMARILQKSGFKKFLVDAGDLYAAGKWTIGIRDPNRPGSGESLCRIMVKNRAVSTSGLYERGNHIIDPRTKKPAQHFGSVTVIAPTSIRADALATGIFVLGKKGMDSLPPHFQKLFRRRDNEFGPCEIFFVAGDDV
jgi:thiamine biosynthesis lipoprotein